MQSSGIISVNASRRGSTRNSTGSIPRVLNASISSLTCMVPSCAENAAPVLPAMMMAAIIAPISRTMAMPTRLARHRPERRTWPAEARR